MHTTQLQKQQYSYKGKFEKVEEEGVKKNNVTTATWAAVELHASSLSFLQLGDNLMH